MGSTLKGKQSATWGANSILLKKAPSMKGFNVIGQQTKSHKVASPVICVKKKKKKGWEKSLSLKPYTASAKCLHS